MAIRLCIALCSLLVAACADSEDLTCIDSPVDCAPLYEPTFENVYANTIAPKCAVGGSSCHGAGATHTEFQGIDVAYEAMVGYELVDPAKPGCGVLERRIASDDPSYVMPVGAKLSDAERCAIHLWIRDGAKR